MDVVSVASHYDATSADFDYAFNCNINDDGTIDIYAATINCGQATPRA